MIDLDPRIVDGMRDQLAVRRERLRAGERALGWKVGFGAPAALDLLGTDRPLVGFLLESNVVSDGASVPVGSWTAPALEPEIAVWLDADLDASSSWAEVCAAVAGVGPAIELADVSPPPEDVVEILRGNIFHRHVILGPVSGQRDGSGVTGRVVRDGSEIAATSNPSAITGEILEVVRLTAELLTGVGEKLRAGEVVITGSVVPPIPVAPGQHVEISLPPLGGLGVTLT